jgi:hypothetical protein
MTVILPVQETSFRRTEVVKRSPGITATIPDSQVTQPEVILKSERFLDESPELAFKIASLDVEKQLGRAQYGSREFGPRSL